MSEPTAARVRRYCDEELPAEEASQLERQLAADPALAQRVEHERRLRDAVERIMRAECPRAPADLADRVRSALADDVPAADETPQRSLAAFLHGPQRANVFAVAATLVLVAGAVLFGIFGTPIDDWRPPAVNLVGEAAPFVCGEHERCAGSAAAMQQNVPFRTAGEAGLHLSEWLGTLVLAEGLTERLREEGWSFMGGGPCGVPVDDPSGHLIYARQDPNLGPIMLSLFMIPDRGNYRVVQEGVDVAVRPGRWIELRDLPRPARVYSDGEIVYMMVMCHPQGGLTRTTAAIESIATPR